MDKVARAVHVVQLDHKVHEAHGVQKATRVSRQRRQLCQDRQVFVACYTQCILKYSKARPAIQDRGACPVIRDRLARMALSAIRVRRAGPDLQARQALRACVGHLDQEAKQDHLVLLYSF